MKKILIVLFLLAAFLQAQAEPERNVPSRLKSDGLAFTENKGQVMDNLGNQRPDVLFTAHNQGVNVYFRQNALSYVFPQIENQNGEAVVKAVYRTDVEFLGANPNPQIVSENVTPGVTNFYLSNGSRNAVQAASFRKLTYRNLYDGIDLVFFATEKNGQSALKYEFVVRAGANPSVIRMRQLAAQKVEVTREGNLMVSNPLGKIEEVAPYTFQNVNGGQQVVASAYEVKNGVVSFRLGSYNSNETLVIDPLTRQWATNVGGSTFDRYLGVHTDANGSVTAVGQSASVNYPTTVGLTQVNAGSQDVVVTRFNANGSVAWSTFYGGTGLDQGFAISGNGSAVTFVGYTTSTNMPTTPGAFQTAASGQGDGFVAQLNAANGQLNWASYVGGVQNDQLNSVSVSQTTGQIFVTGRTFSNGLATIGQTTIAGSRDAVIANMQSTGALNWSTYYGGTGDDQGLGVAVGANDDVYVTGLTASNGLSSPGAFQANNNGGNDAFVGKWSSAGQGQWATYYGGSSTDYANGIAYANGNVFVAGQTSSTNFPVPAGSYQTTSGGLTDAFLFALNGANGNRVMATYIGGNGTDQGFGVAAVGNYVYVVGASNSSNFNLVNPNATNLPFQSGNAGFLDQFVVKFDATASNVASWSILNGGGGDDAARSISANATGAVAVAGYTNSSNYPTRNPLAGQAPAGLGNDDAALIYFNDDTETGEPCIVIGSITQGTIACGGGTTSLNVVALYGGNGTLTYTLNGSMTSMNGMFSDVPAGAYTLVISDGLGCSITRTGTVNGPAPLNVSVSTNNVNCTTGQLGSVMVMVTGGTANYTYSLDGGTFLNDVDNNGSYTFSGLEAGSYSVRVRDNNGCLSASIPVTVTTNAPMIMVNSQSSPRCAGDMNGMISVSIMGGSAPYQFSINGGAFTISQSGSFMFSNLGGGNQVIQVLDANGCSDLENVTLETPVAITLSVNAVNPTSCTSNNGSVTVNVSGGMAPYMYSFDGGLNFGSTNMVMNVGNTTFNIVVRDANGCENRMEQSVRSTDAPQIERVIGVNPSCRINNTAADGQVIILASGMNNPLFYSIQGGATGSFFGSFTGSYTFSGLMAGTYNVAVANDPMGTCITRSTVTITAPPALIVERVVRTQPTCGTTNMGGSLAITATGGVPPYSYSIDGGASFQSSSTFSNLYPKMSGYSVVVIDANGCRSNGGTYFIFNPSGLIISSIVPVVPSCGMSNGSITVIPTGGTLPRWFSINGGMETSSNATNFTFSNLPEGIHRVRVRDNSGCVTEEMVSLATLTLNLVVSNVTTCGGTNGTVTANLIGGVGPYIYTLTGNLATTGAAITQVQSTAVNAQSFVFNNLAPGRYTVTVRDLSTNNSCVASRSANLQSNVSGESVAFTSIAFTNPTNCNVAAADGSITVGATATMPATLAANPYSLLGTVNFTQQATGDFLNLPAGMYWPVAHSANGCVFIGNGITLTGPTNVAITNVAVTQPTCTPSLGTIVVTATGGSTLEYTIDGGTTWQTSNTFNNVNAGVIASNSIQVREFQNGNCMAQHPAAIVLVNPSTMTLATSNIVDQTCAQPNGAFTVTVTGGTAPYRFFIDNVEKTTAAQFGNSFTFTGLTAGVKVVRVVDATGNCPALISHRVVLGTIFDFANPIVNTVTNPTTCVNGAFTIATVGTLVTPTNYYIFGSNSTPQVDNAAFTALPAGNYKLVVVNGNGCRVERDYTLTGTAAPGIFINSITTSNPACPGGAGSIAISGSFNGTPAGAATTRFLNIGTGTAAPQRLLIAQTTPAVPGTYSHSRNDAALVAGTYALTFSWGTGCAYTTNITITDPAPLLVTNVATTQPVCGTNYTGGTITVTATGGTNLLYSINGTAGPFQTSNVFSNVEARRGTPATNVYNVLVRDPSRPTTCQDATWGNNPITVTNPSGLDIIAGTIVQPTCATLANGSLPVTVTAISYPVTLTLMMGTTTVQTFSLASGTAYTFQNLMAGTYMVRATDAQGCQDYFTASLTAPAPLVVTSVPTNPSVCDQINANGMIAFTVTGGATGNNARQYLLISNGQATNNGVFQGVPTNGVIPAFSNLSSGIYQLVVRNTNSPTCSTTAVVVLQDPNTPVFNTAVVIPAGNSACSNGVLEARYTGTGTNLMYEISGNNGFSWSAPQTSRLFLNLAAGTYYVRARTGFGPNFCYSYSTAITVGCTTTKSETLSADANAAVLSVYPNPNSGQFAVSYTATKASTVTLKVVDMTGKVVFTADRNVNLGENVLEINIDEAAAGIYMLQLIDGSEIRTVKVAKN